MPRPNAPRVDAAERDARAMELRATGATYRAIAERLGVSVSTAWECVDRGLTATRQEPGDKLRALERERLDRLQVEATQVLRATHLVVQGGEVVKGEDGRPLVDHGPTLGAIRTLLQVMERRARLEGLDEPTRADISARVHAEVYSTTALDRELERVQRELAELDPDWSAADRRRQDQQGRVDRLRLDWSAPGVVARDPAGFVGAALEMALHLLDLDDQQREAAGLEVERLLWERAR